MHLLLYYFGPTKEAKTDTKINKEGTFILSLGLLNPFPHYLVLFKAYSFFFSNLGNILDTKYERC